MNKKKKTQASTFNSKETNRGGTFVMLKALLSRRTVFTYPELLLGFLVGLNFARLPQRFAVSLGFISFFLFFLLFFQFHFDILLDGSGTFLWGKLGTWISAAADRGW